jgi:hypothetical protein
MEPEKVAEHLRPYVNEDLLRIAKNGLESIGSDLVLYLDTSDVSKGILVTDRSKFLSILGRLDGIRNTLDEPARIKAARNQVLHRHAVVFWFVVVLPGGEVRAQVLTLDNHYRLTTHIVGIA